ncbi:MAG: hypothetical protein PHY48_14365 [Candidatus Cloacimonetes bacterium]|nr:hypothetical protein [Candidatus Cloacimonadota bacterium]
MLASILNILILLCIVMVISGVLRDSGAVVSVYSFLSKHVKSKRGLVAILSVIFGVIPVPGRICFTCGILDSVQDKTRNNQKMGIIAHLSAHHYYLWSPMEKAIIIVCGILGITFTQFISVMWVPALLMVTVSVAYIFSFVSEEEITLTKVSNSDSSGIWSVLGLFGAIIVASIFPIYTTYIFGAYALGLLASHRSFKRSWIDWKVLVFAAIAIALGNIIGSKQAVLMVYLTPYINAQAITAIAALSFLMAFAMGSSAKYAAVCGAIVKVVGLKYLPLFYLVEFAGYMMSPSHDCVAIAKSYFKTPVGMFLLPLVALSIILIGYGVLVLF